MGRPGLPLSVAQQDTEEVSPRPFHDRQDHQDLAALCERAKTAAPRLPDGRLLTFPLQDMARLILDRQKRRVA